MALKPLPLRDTALESVLFTGRAVAAGALILLLIAVLVARMAHLQIFAHQHYTTLSRNNRVSIQPIPPTRGLIYDRNGVLLAENVPSFSLELVPERIEDLPATLQRLGELIDIGEQDIERFHELLKRNRRFEGVPLRSRLSEQEVARLAANRHRFPGVEVNAQLTRRYPLGSLAAHAVGYVGRINERELRSLSSDYSATTHIGKVGVEKAYEHALHGKVGFRQVESNAQGRLLRVLERTLPLPGEDIHLTLDAGLQAAAQRAFGEENGALVALDLQDGGVLALVSLPSYDPNLFVHGIDSATYRALSRSPDRPLFNRALQGQYPPGSIVKPFIGLAALESGTVGAKHNVFCPGWYMLPNDDRKYRDWKRYGHRHVDMTDAIVESCDVYFYDLALTLGIDQLHDYLGRFGFGQPTGIDLPGELSGLMPSREWKSRVHHLPWFPGETLITGIGQGFTLATPLQLASVTATLANGGRRQRPHLLLYAGSQPASADPVGELAVPRQRQANWDIIMRAMEQVVHGTHGTARRIGAEASYRIAGKTGTAQVFGLGQDEEYVAEDIAKKLRDHALFIGYAPADAPRIAVAVLVENGGSGGAVAAPIARTVMDHYLLRNDTPDEGLLRTRLSQP